MSDGGPRLLIADDDEGIRLLLTSFFAKKGFVITAVTNGTAALSALLEGAVDVALLDVMMPGMTGLQVLEEAREAGVRIPIIIATAHGENDSVVQALEYGADDYVAKPFDLAVLHARIVARLRASKAASFAIPPPSNPGLPFAGPDDAVGTETAKRFVAEEGAVIDGRYELLRPIGKGSFGVVWRARHRGLETDVAVKLLNPDDEDGGTEPLEGASPRSNPAGASFSERSDELRLEGVRAARVQHPHAVRVFDVGILADGTPYLVMELIDGSTVEDVLRRHGALDITTAVEIMIPVAEALAAAHAEGVIHRDVKPANVMLQAAGVGTIVKVLDFGVAKLTDVGKEHPAGYIEGANEVSSRVVAGSPAYLAPERLRGLPYDGRADVYAMGVMLFELLTGQVPFTAPDGDLMKVAVMHLKEIPPKVSERNPTLPTGLDDLVARLLEKTPAKRPTATETVELLRDMLDYV